MAFTAAQAARYNDPKGKRCDCGEPAVIVRMRHPICQRCKDIESSGLYDIQQTFTTVKYNEFAKYYARFGMA